MTSTGKNPGRLRRWWERKRQRAAALLDRPSSLESTATRAETKVARVAEVAPGRQSRTVGKLRQAWADVQVMVRLVRAFARGEYRDVSRTTIGLIVGALVYFVSPIDAILDHLPLTGYLDDAAILAWVVSEVRAEIDAFRSWEGEQPQRALQAQDGTSSTAGEIDGSPAA